MYPRFVIFLLSLALWVGTCLGAVAAGRVALVIGNGDYEAANPLKNPITDATAVNSALTAAGFEVTYKENLNYSEMVRELGSFQRIAAKSESAVIYYAGHGMEIDKQNYLIPVDAQLEFMSDADFQTVPLQLLQRAVAEADVLGLVIVDACRNNPFATRLSQVESNRGVGFGLARVEPGGNTVVALAAREGTFAFDGKGDNSPYALALVKAIRTPGLEIGKMFRQLQDDVLAQTNGAQEPVLFGSLPSEDYYFLPPENLQVEPVPASAETPATISDAAVALQVELAFWQAAEGSGRAEDYALYLESYPAGKFAPLAQARLARLSAETAPAALTPDPVAPAEPVQLATNEPAPPSEPPPPPPEPPPSESAAVEPVTAEPAVEEPAAPKPPAVEPSATVPAAPDATAPAPQVSEPAVPTETAKAPEPAPPAPPEVLAEPAAPAAPPDPPVLPVLADASALPPIPGADPSVGETVRAAFSADLRGLTPVTAEPEALPEPELTGKALHAALQTALAAAGCNPGPIDGDWGAGSTRALTAFAKVRPDLVSADADPDAALLRALAQASGPVCPTQCANGENLVGGECVTPVSCPTGQKLSSKGECYVPAPAVRQKPAAKPRSSGCRIFNGRQIC